MWHQMREIEARAVGDIPGNDSLHQTVLVPYGAPRMV